MLTLDLPDEALENAAGSVWEKAGAVTLSFCSGLDKLSDWGQGLKPKKQFLICCFSKRAVELL